MLNHKTVFNSIFVVNSSLNTFLYVKIRYQIKVMSRYTFPLLLFLPCSNRFDTFSYCNKSYTQIIYIVSLLCY